MASSSTPGIGNHPLLPLVDRADPRHAGPPPDELRVIVDRIVQEHLRQRAANPGMEWRGMPGVTAKRARERRARIEAGTPGQLAVVSGPTAPVVGSIIKLDFYTYYNSQLGINTSYWTCTQLVGGGGSFQQAANTFALIVGAEYIKHLVLSAKFYGTTLVQLSPVISATFESFYTPLAGIVTGPTLPTQVTGLARILTAAPGRAGHSRKYWPFVPASYTTDGLVLTPAAQTGYTALLDWFVRPFNDYPTDASQPHNTWAPVGWHRETGTATPVVSSLQSKWLATQRRRGDFGTINPAPGAGGQ
jgi:hypothetical protein